METPTVSLISLGCPRTLVDSEVYLGRLAQQGFRVVEEVEGSDAVIINTCSFVQEAIKESVDTILKAVEMKRAGRLKAVVVAGCLAQRFKGELIKELPEVDGFVGVDGFGDIEMVVRDALRGRQAQQVRERPVVPHRGPRVARVALSPAHYAYLKISEGCLKGCSFCIIPKIKGPLSSRPMDDVTAEARQLVEERGVRELIVVGQDTSDYGVDLYGRPRIAELLSRLAKIEGLRWIRLLYCHPRGITPALIQTIRDEPVVCKYLDSAIEHADDAVLARMNRGVTRAQLGRTIATLRQAIPGMTLRTSVIVGFPGEDDAAFETLLAFLREAQFERLGAFQYSQEEGTASARYPDQVPEAVKTARYDRLMQVQQEIAEAVNRRVIGSIREVLIDEVASDPSTPPILRIGVAQDSAPPQQVGVGLHGEFQGVGRTSSDCPEVDGEVFVSSPRPLQPGELVQVEMTDSYEYDLAGRVVDLPQSLITHHSSFVIRHSSFE